MNGKTQDLRQHLRFELLEYTLIHQKECPITTRAVMVDISLGGIQVRSRDCFNPGEKFQIEIGRNGEDSLIVNAECRYCSLVPGSELFASGFRFKPRRVAERIELVTYVHDIFQRQGESLIP